MSDVAADMADDVQSHINSNDRPDEWSKTYDVNLFGQKYTVTMAVEMQFLSLPVVGQIRLDTNISMVMLANTDEVLQYEFEYTEDARAMADTIRQQLAMAHGRRMQQMSYDESGYTLF